MANKTDIKEPVTIDNTRDNVLPTRPKKVDLKGIDNVRLEMASV